MKNILITFVLALSMQSCMVHQNSWVKEYEKNQSRTYPEDLRKHLHESNFLTLDLNSPGRTYKYDIGEKDKFYDHDSDNWMLDKIFFKFKNYTNSGKLLTDIDIVDKKGNKFHIPDFDILRLVHKYDTSGDLLYAETIEEEYNRYGLSFRREHGEFSVQCVNSEMQHVADRIMRLSITNNCLNPNKWELWIGTEEFSDFKSRAKSKINFNHKRTLSHSWFYMDNNIYTAMLKMKNPSQAHDYPSIDYEEATLTAEKQSINFDQLRHRIVKTYHPKMLEVGHQSHRVLEPVDMEEHYKWEYGIFMNKQEFSNYSDILDRPVTLARFDDMGFYNPETPNIYDYSFLRGVDRVELNRLGSDLSDTYFEIRLTGDHAQYDIVLGNVDLALLNDLKLRGYLFGFNTYPKGRRYNHSQNTTFFDADSYPDKKIQPYLLLVDKQTGKYLNNQKKGVEKLYIGYDKADKESLVIYLLSYERIAPVWMSRVKVPMSVFQSVRAKKNLF